MSRTVASLMLNGEWRMYPFLQAPSYARLCAEGQSQLDPPNDDALLGGRGLSRSP